MNCFIVFYLLLIVKSVFSYNSPSSSMNHTLLDPCPLEDLKCLGKSTHRFLEKTFLGIPKFNMKPIDPVFISDAKVHAFEGANLYFKDIYIMGFKELQIYDFKLDKADCTVRLVTKFNAVCDAYMKIAFTKLSKNFTGTLGFSIDALATAKYNYTLKDITGIEYFDLGPETITCNDLSSNVMVNPELNEQIYNDVEANKFMTKKKTKLDNLWKSTPCKLIEKGYKAVIHNLRMAAHILPVTSFFTDF